MREQSILHRILLACSTGATRLFRVNTGIAYAGKGKATSVTRPQMVMMYPGDVLVRSAQPIRMGLTNGGSDLIGWTKVGDRAVFTAIECKSATGRVRHEQQVFIDAVRAAGGIAGVARSEDEASALIDAYRSSAGC